MRFISGTGILLVYMLPSILVTGGLLWEYHYRICNENGSINIYAPMARVLYEIENNDKEDETHPFIADGHLSQNDRREIVRRFRKAQREYRNVSDKVSWLKSYLSKTSPLDYCRKIWRENSIIILLMVIMPFLMFAMRLGYDGRLDCTTRERFALACENWPMKLIVAGVIGVGWMYLLNPYGRAATTFYQTYLLYSVPPINTLPIYIAVPDISHTVAGFLGWYLNFLFYVFTKLYHNDVTSSRMYRFLFVKLLFTYGLALVSEPVLESEGKLAMFLIGFFPLSAAMSIRRMAARVLHATESDSDDLSALPGMSTWTTLRLQEEGVNSITTLATLHIEEIKKYFPLRIAHLLRMWIDAARLHTAVGGVAYAQLKPVCQTASEFIELCESDEFEEKVKQLTGIEYVETVASRIRTTFPEELFTTSLTSAVPPIPTKFD